MKLRAPVFPITLGRTGTNGATTARSEPCGSPMLRAVATGGSADAEYLARSVIDFSSTARSHTLGLGMLLHFLSAVIPRAPGLVRWKSDLTQNVTSARSFGRLIILAGGLLVLAEVDPFPCSPAPLQPFAPGFHFLRQQTGTPQRACNTGDGPLSPRRRKVPTRERYNVLYVYMFRSARGVVFRTFGDCRPLFLDAGEHGVLVGDKSGSGGGRFRARHWLRS